MIMENNLIGKRFGRLIVVSKADDYISKKGLKEEDGDASAIVEMKKIF